MIGDSAEPRGRHSCALGIAPVGLAIGNEQ